MTTPFDAKDVAWRYRYAHGTNDTAECLRLREAWKEQQGEDSLHERAWGETIGRKALDERINKLIDRQIDTLHRWPATLCEITRDDSGNVIHRNFVFGDPENADTREARAIFKESQAIKKELLWVMRNGGRFLPKDIAE
jgi:hypothetical protein